VRLPCTEREGRRGALIKGARRHLGHIVRKKKKKKKKCAEEG
jgi:hypothetical protein